jgi:predicted TIM-barrel fold metal-dependent hydrolase
MSVTDTSPSPVSLTPADVKVVDCDTHLSEPHDLFTSQVPASMKDKVPHVAYDSDGERVWLFDGDEVLMTPTHSGSSVRKDGTKKSFWEYNINRTMQIEETFPAAYDPAARVEMMDDQSIWAQIIYPNLLGFAANKLVRHPDKSLANFIVSVYNDAVAQMQETSGNRLFPQALVPFWDIDASVKEVERAHNELHLTGITMCSEPHAGDLPDLVNRHWDPLWEVCSELEMPINFHTGASEFGTDAFLKSVWPSQDRFRKHICGAVNLELHNARILNNLLASDLLDRFPKTKWVTVESGIGWIPFVIERLQYQLTEALPEGGLDDGVMEFSEPLDLFHRQVYACFWFEEVAPSRMLDYIGFDNVLFESDFPHPTCLYPSAVEHGLRVLAPWGPDVQRKVMQDNAVKLYKLPLPA